MSTSAPAPPPDPLDSALAGLKAAIVRLPQKKRDILIKWLIKWSRYLSMEATFKPDYVPRYKRGDILYVDFGFNIGNEFGAIHYAAVLEHDNNKTNGNITVIPLTSLDAGKSAADLSPTEICLGTGVIPWTPKIETIVKTSQLRAVSKMRIIKPLKKGDQWARLTPTHLDLIDDKLTQTIIRIPTLPVAPATKPLSETTLSAGKSRLT